ATRRGPPKARLSPLAMDLTFTPQQTAFRDELRGWLADTPPDPKPADGGEDAEFAWRRDWQRCLYDAGWAAPSWPTEYGGRLVARTDSEVPKHKGLTYFLMDMQQDAVQVRPLRQITGEAEFNELFIEEARIPDANVVGGVGNGWKVALTTLMNERAGLGFALQIRLRQLLDDVIAIAARRGLLDDHLYADPPADLHVRCESIRLLAGNGLT